MSNVPAIFLSASVPKEGSRWYEDHDPFLIKEAVAALIEVVMGRLLLVWGGHPAITPMIWEAAKMYHVSYAKVVKLYQSEYFKGSYPEENKKFGNFVETESIRGDLQASLAHMRKVMLSQHDFKAAVFIGGMEGVEEEYALFRELHPKACLLPIPSPGGCSRELYCRNRDLLPAELEFAVDFTYWFYKLLKPDLASNRKKSLES